MSARPCSNCGAPDDDVMDCAKSVLVCMNCGHLMPEEGVPDAPDDLLERGQ